jgi:hypothetical protein
MRAWVPGRARTVPGQMARDTPLRRSLRSLRPWPATGPARHKPMALQSAEGQQPPQPPPFSAPHTRSGVIGSSRMRKPVAAAMAFATAAGTPTTGGSPTPLAP